MGGMGNMGSDRLKKNIVPNSSKEKDKGQDGGVGWGRKGKRKKSRKDGSEYCAWKGWKKFSNDVGRSGGSGGGVHPGVQERIKN